MLIDKETQKEQIATFRFNKPRTNLNQFGNEEIYELTENSPNTAILERTKQ